SSFFFSSRRRHTRFSRDWSSDVCSSDLGVRTALPFTLGFLPYGLVIGAAADHARVDDMLGWSTAWLTYAGASQLVLIQMLDVGRSEERRVGKEWRAEGAVDKEAKE